MDLGVFQFRTTVDLFLLCQGLFLITFNRKIQTLPSSFLLLIINYNCKIYKVIHIQQVATLSKNIIQSIANWLLEGYVCEPQLPTGFLQVQLHYYQIFSNKLLLDPIFLQIVAPSKHKTHPTIVSVGEMIQTTWIRIENNNYKMFNLKLSNNHAPSAVHSSISSIRFKPSNIISTKRLLIKNPLDWNSRRSRRI